MAEAQKAIHRGPGSRHCNLTIESRAYRISCGEFTIGRAVLVRTPGASGNSSQIYLKEIGWVEGYREMCIDVKGGSKG